MYYKGIIFDLDNTLYSYTECHKVALRTCINYLCEKVHISETSPIEQKYHKIANQLKHELPGVASSHNKAIYFKQLLENLGVSYGYFQPIHDLYWNTFYENIQPFNGVLEFMEWNRRKGIKIGVLTDYETEYQIIKLEKLGLLEFVDHIVTSEEVGIEKPSRRAFLTILDRMKLPPTDVCMIGDNYEKDIQGALELGIRGLWFCPNGSSNSETFSSYVTLFDETIQFYEQLTKFVEISRYCGERFDLVQAGGGNVSVKIGDKMIIKSSGVHMANITTTGGYSIIDNCTLRSDMENNNTSQKDVGMYIVGPQMRPSIETYMHSILKTYTIHVHPIQTNRILVTKDARQQITILFTDSLVLDYYTPGIDLAMEIMKQYRGESVIFLVNHGIIVTTDDYSEIRNLLEGVLEKCEQYQGLDFTKYKLVNKISQYLTAETGENYITYLATNRDIYYFLENHRNLFSESHTFPDALIYCGMRVLVLTEDEKFKSEIDLYRELYFESPKIIIYQENLYIVAATYQKCKEIEDLLVANLWILNSDSEKQYLSSSEIQFLNGWDAEKYRKTLS